MDKKVQQLFDYQKFANNEELSQAIKTCEKPSEYKKQKPKPINVYGKIAATMTASTAAAIFFLVLNTLFRSTGTDVGRLAGVASVFSDGGSGLIIAGTILVFGIIVSVILYRKDKGNRKS